MSDCQWEPSLSYFWVRVNSNVVVLIKEIEKRNCNLLGLGKKPVKKNDSELRVISCLIYFIVGWALRWARILQSNVVISQLLVSQSISSCEVDALVSESLRVSTSFVDPLLPVDAVQDQGSVFSKICLNKGNKIVSEFQVCDALLFEL